jgi:hypothetical protein
VSESSTLAPSDRALLRTFAARFRTEHVAGIYLSMYREVTERRC